jgi:hypothetical protein
MGCILFRRVHEVKLGLPPHQLFLGRIVPDRYHRLADLRVQLGLRPGLERVVEQEVTIIFVDVVHGLDLELAHGTDDSLGALDQVLEDGRSVVVELVFAVAFQVDDLHLLDDGRLAALAGA